MLPLLLINWLLIILLMTTAWLVLLKIDNPGIVDFFWPISISLSGFIFFTFSYKNNASIIFIILLLIWGIRLSGYLLQSRIIPQLKETRYDAIVPPTQKNRSFLYFRHFQFQGILGMILALPFLFINKQPHPLFYYSIGAAITLLGLIGEILSDYQLQDFKRNFPGQVCDAGFWEYSRHPNYFFEWLIWVGFAISGFSLEYGWIGLLSPLLLLFLMLQFTIPITEQASVRSRKEKYINYQQKTPVFFPSLFCKKKKNDNTI